MGKFCFINLLLVLFVGISLTAQESCDQQRDRCLEAVRNGSVDSPTFVNDWYQNGLDWCESKYQDCLQSPIRYIPLACRATWRWGCKTVMRVLKISLKAIAALEPTRLINNEACWRAYEACLEARGSASL